MNTPEGLGESAPLLAPEARRRRSYLAPSSARNAIAATLVSGCVVAVLAVSGRYGSSPVVHEERSGLSRMATLSDAPKQPAPNARATPKKTRVEQPTRTAPKAKVVPAARAKKPDGESDLAGGNFFTQTFDALDVLHVVPDMTPDDSSYSSGPAPGPEPWDWFAMAPGPGSFEDFYPGTNGCEARCEGVDINEDMCRSMPYCEWDDGLCWSAVGPNPCPDDDAFGPAMAPEPAPGPDFGPGPEVGPTPTVTPGASGPAMAPQPTPGPEIAPGPEVAFGPASSYPGTNGCEARCEGVDINEDMCRSMPYCEWDDGLCWSAVGPNPCPDDDAFGPAMAPEPAPGPDFGPGPEVGPTPTVTPGASGPAMAPQPTPQPTPVPGTGPTAKPGTGPVPIPGSGPGPQPMTLGRDESVLFEDEVFRGDIINGVSEDMIQDIIRTKIADHHYKGPAEELAMKRFDFHVRFKVTVEGAGCPAVDKKTFESVVKSFVQRAASGDDMSVAPVSKPVEDKKVLEQLAERHQAMMGAAAEGTGAFSEMNVGECETVKRDGAADAHAFVVELVIPREGPETNAQTLANEIISDFSTDHIKAQLQAKGAPLSKIAAASVSVDEVVIHGKISVEKIAAKKESKGASKKSSEKTAKVKA